jgi:hypothetical protein
VSDRAWLVLGWAGSVTRNRTDTESAAVLPTTKTKDDAELASLSVGLRRVMTRPGALVDFSLQATVDGGYVHEFSQDKSTGGAQFDTRTNGRYVAVTGGFALERELTGGLALRISTPLVAASWARAEVKNENLATRKGESTNLSLTLAPRLELRLAF